MLNKMQRRDLLQCGQWINKTALFFIANEPYNVFFQFLTYYNVFLTMKLLLTKEGALRRGLVSFRSSLRDLVLVQLLDANLETLNKNSFLAVNSVKSP